MNRSFAPAGLVRLPRRAGLGAACLALATFGGAGVGCQSDAQTGGLTGAGVGALAGQAIGNDTESTLIGTAVGGALGYVIGNEADKQKQRDRDDYYREQNYSRHQDQYYR